LNDKFYFQRGSGYQKSFKVNKNKTHFLIF